MNNGKIIIPESIVNKQSEVLGEVRYEIYYVERKTDDGLTIRYEPRIYRELIEQHFPDITQIRDKILFSAAFDLTARVMKSFDTLNRAEVFEDETDPSALIWGHVLSAKERYGIDDLNDMMRFMPQVHHFAVMNKRYWDDRFSAWLDSGGNAYNEITREEKAVNKQ